MDNKGLKRAKKAEKMNVGGGSMRSSKGPSKRGRSEKKGRKMY